VPSLFRLVFSPTDASSRSLEDTEAQGCHFIKDTERQKRSLALRVSENPLGHLIRDPTNILEDPTFPTVSPGALIDAPDNYLKTTWGAQDQRNRTFLPSERADLCYTLANSLLHLSGGAWSHIEWSIDKVYFLEDASTQNLLDKSKPYLSWALEPSINQTQGESTRTDNFLYNFHLVDFARLLMEVHAGERIPYEGPPGGLQLHLYHLMHDERRFMTSQNANFRLAVEACLGPAGKEAA
jgi:hypothetical protein